MITFPPCVVGPGCAGDDDDGVAAADDDDGEDDTDGDDDDDDDGDAGFGMYKDLSTSQ